MSLIPTSTKFNLSLVDLPARERLLSAEELENAIGGCQSLWFPCSHTSDCCSGTKCVIKHRSGRRGYCG